MRWFNRKPVEKAPEKVLEEIPFLRQGGILDPRSSTWHFVHSWAQEKLNKARARNDSANADIIQTSVMRGEIKVLKELISLPNPKKGLLIEEY